MQLTSIKISIFESKMQIEIEIEIRFVQSRYIHDNKNICDQSTTK